VIRAAAIALAALAGAAGAEPPALSLPVDCTLGEECFIQQYLDHDPGPGAHDWRCRALSYDGHQGTDFRLPDTAAMRHGVAVLAAAPGRVIGVRDGMPDIAADADGAPDLAGRDCGNGVLIDHGTGWQTQYCHLRRGSLAVMRGETVGRGEMLGLVGLSGRTQFPHLHLSLRHEGREVDPFAPEGAQCPARDLPAAGGLWKDPPAYQPGGIMSAGLLTRLPDYDEVRDSPAQADGLPSDAPALVLWAFVFGAEPGDRLAFTLDGPGGIRVIGEEVALDRRQAQLYRAVGRRLPPQGWPPGDYAGEIRLVRDGTVIDRRMATGAIRP